MIGYKVSTAQVTLSGPSTTADFQLTENPLQLGDVVVTGAGTTSEVLTDPGLPRYGRLVDRKRPE